MGFISDIIARGYGGYAGWNNDAAAEADFKATNGSGKWTGGATGTSGSTTTTTTKSGPSKEEIARIVTQFNPAAIKYQPYEQAALAELAPYYQKILDQEGGDVERAKKRMEEDYSRGVRYSTEDLQRGTVQRGEDLSSFQKYEESQFPQEDRQLLESMNARGILNSGITGNEMGRLKLSQEKRKEAITRALKRQEDEQTIGHARTLETSALTKARGTEDLSTAFERYTKEQEQTKRREATSLGAERFGRAVSLKQLEQQQALQPVLYGT